jgi:hypothetical protein
MLKTVIHNIAMHFSEREFPTEFIKENSSRTDEQYYKHIGASCLEISEGSYN